MSYTNNKKLNYLLNNVFNSLVNTKLSFLLDNIIQNTDIQYYKENHKTMSRLEKIYPVKFFYRKSKPNVNYKNDNLSNKSNIKKPDNHIKTENVKKIDNTQDHNHEKKIIELEHLSSNLNKEVKHIQTSIKNTNSNLINACPIEILSNLVKMNSYSLLEFSKLDDYYSLAFLSSLSTNFYISSDDFKKDYLKQFKLDVITKFNKEDFYKDFDYSVKQFKKSDLDETFCFNKNITLNMLKVYSDVLNINCVYIFNNNIEFITKFNPNIATVILAETNNKIYSLSRTDSFIRGSECSKELGIFTKFSKETLQKYKLEKLQNIAKMYNKDIKKAGKVGKVNIKKEELIDLLAIN